MQQRKKLTGIDSKVYWRSDSRSPETIFKSGFNPREPLCADYWKQCIRVNEHLGMCDANKDHCVCMTTHFESAGFFPIVDPRYAFKKGDITYFYAIALPAALKISPLKELYDDADYKPYILDDVVIDMHSFQTEYASQRIDKFDKNNKNYKQEKMVQGGILCAHEAFASRVNRANIIGAVQVIRGPSQTQNYYDLPSRHFSVSSHIYINELFSATQKMLIVDQGHTGVIEIDYSKRQAEALKQMTDAAEKWLPTPTALFGLAGKTFGSPSANNITRGLFARPKPSVPLLETRDSDRYVLSLN